MNSPVVRAQESPPGSAQTDDSGAARAVARSAGASSRGWSPDDQSPSVMDVTRCTLCDASRVCAWCLTDVGARSDEESYYVLVQLEDRAAFGRHDAEFIDYLLPVPVLSTPAYVRPLDAAPLEGAQTDFDLLFVLCGNGCSKNLVEALQIDRRVLSIEPWSNGSFGVQVDEDEEDDQGDED